MAVAPSSRFIDLIGPMANLLLQFGYARFTAFHQDRA